MIRRTPAQLRFIQAYLHDRTSYLNATRSYMIAYPKANYHTARVNSSKLMRDPSVQADVEKEFKEKYPTWRRPLDHTERQGNL